jgi:hypothetical protein
VVVSTPKGLPRQIKASVLEKSLENGHLVNMDFIVVKNMQYAAPIVNKPVKKELKPQISK